MQHILYFSGHRMVVYRWQNNHFTGFAEFEPNEGGVASFERLLQREVKRPLRMIIDVIEEDFRIENIPHVIGTDRSALLSRTLNKTFRANRHRYIQVQGREDTGRRDDIVMMSAITNPDLFKHWIDVIIKNKIPFEGIYSLPFIGELLLKPLGAHKGKTLLISQQVASNIRQSFYIDGQLKLSRLAPSQDEMLSQSQVLIEETERTVRYLENQHMYNTGDPFNIFVIVPMHQAAETAKALRSDTYKTYHVVSRETLAKELGIKQQIKGDYCDAFFAHVVLKNKKLKSHYTVQKERKYFYHYRANQVLAIFSVLLFFLCIVFSGVRFAEAFVNAQEMPNLQSQTAQLQRLEEQTLNAIESVDIKVDDIRDIVNIAEAIESQYKFDPFQLINNIAPSVTESTDISISNIQWLATYDHTNNIGETVVELDRRELRRLENSKILYQKALLQAKITDFNNNPRLAVERVLRFRNQLAENAAFTKVEIIRMPFDLAPDSRFEYQAISELSGNRESEATFEIVVVMQRDEDES